MNNKIAAISIYIIFFTCTLFGNEPAIRTISTFKQNPNHLYVGPEIFAFNLNSHFKNVRIHGTKFFMGLRLGYEYLKPDACYFGIDILGAGGVHGFHETLKGGDLPRNNGTTGFANVDIRLGYTLITNRWLATPYLCYGAYAFRNGCHDHYFEEGITYLGGGIRSRCEISHVFSAGLNARIFASLYTDEKFRFSDVKRSNHHGLWGGEIGVPLTWYMGSNTRWDIQLEPYFLKLDFSEIQNIYGLRLLFGYHF